MRKLLLVVVLFQITSYLAYSQWKSSDIPDSLKRNSDAVVRRLVTDIKIISSDKITITENIVVTILNEEGKVFANFSEYYDKDSKFEYVKGVIYNDGGGVIKGIKWSDFQDVSLVSDYSIYEDNRLVRYEVIPTSYPFTVEYEYRKIVNTAMFIPPWYPQGGFRLGLENASLRVSFPDTNPLLYKSFNIGKPTKTGDEDGSRVLLWRANCLKAIEKEVYSPKFYEYSPAVFLGAKYFSIGGYNGTMDSWNSYGLWLEDLQKGRSDISLELYNKIRVLVKDERDLRKKVNIVYKYMQSQTRYVSIQVGVGGWQPFPASTVEKNGYGDCKALVNFTRSLLETIGVKSFYCPIGVGEQNIIFDDFPGLGQTNHIILCVPNGNDSLWLECTNQHYPFGFISHEFQNQKVLLVDGVSSRLINMPKGDANKNVQIRVTNVQIDSLGDAIGNMITYESGAELENLMPEIWSNKKDQAEMIQKKYRIPGIVFKSFDYQFDDNSEPKANEKISFQVGGFASQTGRRFFIPFNPFAQIGSIPNKSKKRLTDVLIDECYTHIDTLKYSLPKGFNIEFIPRPKSISGLFGSFDSSTKVEGDKLITIRKYQQKRGKYLAKDFNKYIEFLLDIAKQDKQPLVIVSK
ncbi:MAG: DUF3857 domain-containing protein [Bacteroidales bacterium]|nr:DUF3857 domain-containing protein [Bacteroidales bacterium]